MAQKVITIAAGNKGCQISTIPRYYFADLMANSSYNIRLNSRIFSGCLSQAAFLSLYALNNSSCRKAARERIPGSIDDYVTGVSERSQRVGGSKNDGYTQQ